MLNSGVKLRAIDARVGVEKSWCPHTTASVRRLGDSHRFLSPLYRGCVGLRQSCHLVFVGESVLNHKMAWPNKRKKLKVILAILMILRRRRKSRYNASCRKMWEKTWIQRRGQLGIYHTFVQELALVDAVCYKQYFRMSQQLFRAILDNIAPAITKQTTKLRRPISAAERLAITLRFLATGETFRSLMFAYRVGERTISGIVKETCQALYQNLKDTYLKVPNTSTEWKTVAKNFYEKWNYPLCLGALDGKHFALIQPALSRSTYFNYKHFFSVVLLALVDANYRFLYINVGDTGRSGDAGIFLMSDLKEAMETNALEFPAAELIPGSDKMCHYHIIGDDAFPLRTDLIKPHPFRKLDHDKQIFNYRFSRARRVVENAFGILANRFRVFLNAIHLEPETVECLIQASCCLHNYLIEHQSPHYVVQKLADSEDPQHNLIKVKWRDDPQLLDLEATQARNATASAKEQRDILGAFFLSEDGAVSWQEKHIHGQ